MNQKNSFIMLYAYVSTQWREFHTLEIIFVYFVKVEKFAYFIKCKEKA